MKLSEIEKSLQKGDITEETISEFKAALKRTSKSNRCQHCYTTAATFPKERWEDAISLIRYGLDVCESSWVDKMRSYCNMASIYERVSDYSSALGAYQDALAAVTEECRAPYTASISADMMRIELHRSDFVYTDALRQYYLRSMQQDAFSRSFAHSLFYQAIAEMVLYTKSGETEKADAAYCRAKDILSPKNEGPLTKILRRHRYMDAAKATKEAIHFLNLWKR